LSNSHSTSTLDIVTGFGVLSSLHLRASANHPISDSIAVAFCSSVLPFLIFHSFNILDTSSIARASCGDLTSSSSLKNQGLVSTTSPTIFCFSLIHISDSFGTAISSACFLNASSEDDISFLLAFDMSGVTISIAFGVITFNALVVASVQDLTIPPILGIGAMDHTLNTPSNQNAKLGYCFAISSYSFASH
jgi:hypothetical protein